MLKIALGVIIVAFTTYLGYFFSEKFRRKKAFYKDWNEFNERFLTELSFRRLPLLEFIAEYAYASDFSDVLNSFTENLSKDGFPISPPYLTKDERSFLTDYFSMLGKGDSASQKGYFTSVKSVLSNKTAESDRNCKKYADLYVKLGFLLGLALLVLIV